MAKRKTIDTNQIDIKEDDILNLDLELLEILLKDRSSGKNIIWATDNYKELGDKFSPKSQITVDAITGDYNEIIQPRIKKSREVQEFRSKDKAEVFTPSWVCNKQNNLIDNAFFCRENMFNIEIENGWVSNQELDMSDDEWRAYVRAKRLEITCGEAPYITSRYDAVTGDFIEPLDRVGILDRKFRVVHQFKGGGDVSTKEWLKWMKVALQSTYGYEWQGDNLLLARENILLTFIDFYKLRYPSNFPTIKQLREVAEIISWNIWQMDGLRMVIPETCEDKEIVEQYVQLNLFEEVEEPKVRIQQCPGCKNNDIHSHNGIQCKIREWFNEEGKYIKPENDIIPFHTIVK